MSRSVLELPADAAREQSNDEGVEADSLLGGEGGEAGVEVGREPEMDLSGDGRHKRHTTVCGILSATDKSGRRRWNAPAPATGGRS